MQMISSAGAMKEPENVFSLYVGCSSFSASLFEMQSVLRREREREREKEARACLKARDWVVLLIELILYESK